MWYSLKAFLIVLTYIVLFTAAQLLMAKHWPWIRLGLFVLIPLTWLVKKKFDDVLSSILDWRKAIIALQVIFVLLALFRGGQAVRKFMQDDPRVEDIADVYVKANEKFFKEGINPYNTDIDPYKVEVNGEVKVFSAPKYPPLQMFIYAPFTLLFGVKGIYAANLIAYVLFLLILFNALRPFGMQLSWLGGILFLSVDFFFHRCVGKGTNDFYPALFLLLSYLELLKSRNLVSGIYLGLSFACKQLPAGLIGLIYLLQKKWKPFLWSALPVLVITVPFLITGWEGFYENNIVFNLIRPVRETSLLLDIPVMFHRWVSVLGFVGVALFAIWGNRTTSLWSLDRSWLILTVSMIILIVTSKMSPTNYFVWVLPFYLMWFLTPAELEKA